jgi:ubiquitin C-terminal hydrolase
MSIQKLYTQIKFGTIKDEDRQKYFPVIKLIEPPTIAAKPKLWSSLVKREIKRKVKAKGLINNGNFCFMNSILQPLVYLPQFYSYLNKVEIKDEMYLTAALKQFLNEFESESETPLDANFVLDAILKRGKINHLSGRQEDAQEYLGFLLDGLQEELVQYESKEEDNEWFDVTNSKPAKPLVKQTMLNMIIGGRLKCVIKSHKYKTSYEPFQILQLPINVCHFNFRRMCFLYWMELSRLQKKKTLKV